MSAGLKLDSVGLHVLHNALGNIAAEMALVMKKTSYSTIFNEGLDFSTVLLDREGNLIAEKNYTPSMMGAIPNTVRWTLEEFGEGFFEPGDVVVHNDPYRGQCHLPEHMVMAPIFQDGELIAFAGNIGHLAEVGGKAPGSFASDATDVYQEGLRLPPVKLFERGKYNEQVWRIILANHRTPRNTWGDFHAMVGALRVGERRFLALCDRYDADSIREGAARLIDHSERRLRAEIAELPDGRHEAAMMVEDDGVSSDPFEVKVAVVVRGDEVIVDFTGSSPQVRGPMNCTYVVAASAAYNAVFCVTDPEMEIPRNSGCYRPVRIIAPPGTVVNVRHPGPSVGGNTDLQPKLIDLLLRAFGEVTRHSNCRNTPVEVFEYRYPLLTLDHGLARDSGGAGRHRGGLSTYRTLRVLAPEITFSALFDRCRIAPWGLAGGHDALGSELLVRRVGEPEFRRFDEVFGVASPTKFTNVVLHAGDELRYRTPGGGGYGDPAERDRELVREDVAEGYVSAEAAARDYGLEGGA
jgi:N-methylhydantoinase B/oxoprolinase/acetone carboxylase alpha subunit